MLKRVLRQKPLGHVAPLRELLSCLLRRGRDGNLPAARRSGRRGGGGRGVRNLPGRRAATQRRGAERKDGGKQEKRETLTAHKKSPSCLWLNRRLAVAGLRNRNSSTTRWIKPCRMSSGKRWVRLCERRCRVKILDRTFTTAD